MPGPEAITPVDRGGEARGHFEKGNALFKTGALAPALAEFLESRRLFPTRSATSNAALCLARLQRFDEALDMYESLLKEFPDLPADTRTSAQREVVRLRGLVGAIEVAEAEIGAAITVDGQSRGDYPPVTPLRTAAGSHIVRVYKEGFEPFEGRADVVGGGTARVSARLRALVLPGRLRVTEQSGKALGVVVDGNMVGKTPWEGPLLPGAHTVFLSGEGPLGTQPVSAAVKLGDLTPLTLVAEELTTSLRVEPMPAGASVAIDSVTVGQGIWEGRLRAGLHKLEVFGEGFRASAEQVHLEQGKREVLTVLLERDPSAPMWRRPSRITLEIGASLPLAPSFGGDVAGRCGDGCSRSAGVGGQVAFHGGFELGSGLGFGVAAGYVSVSQSVTNRVTTLTTVGMGKPTGLVDDALRIRGFLAGAWTGFVFGERFPLRLRLGAGALIASVLDERSGTFGGVAADPSGIAQSSTFFYVAPEVRAGVRLGKHVEVTAGLTTLVLVGLSRPRWDENLAINAGRYGIAYYAADNLTSQVVALATPSVGARYDF